MKVSRSSYYKWIKFGCPSPSDRDAVILAVIRRIERDNDGNYGVRRVHRSLNDEHGIRCGYGKTARIMRQGGIKAKIRTKYKPQTTKADASESAYPNLLEQQFGETKKNRVWLSDITYVRVNGAWNYLAAELACRALRNALLKERPPEGLIHHSDRGCQYTSKVYRRLLEQNKITGSMSRKSSPYDNAPMESFFQTLKTEHIYKQSFQTIEQATASLMHWIDVYYNCRRLHSALGYKSPLFYELSRYHPFTLSA